MTSIPGLLRQIVDYAGLFPPSRLPMDQAVANYARYRRGEEKEMLAAFVVPVDRVDEMLAAAEAQGLSFEPAWPLSLLVVGDLAAAAERIRAVRAGETRVDVVALESKASGPEEVELLRRSLGPEMPLFVEIPRSEDPGPWVAAARAHGARGKIRCGGIESSMIPTIEALSRFLRACIDAELPFKCTAGLHHPVRAEQPLTYEEDPPRAIMHGYLNVFVGALLYRCGEITASTLEEVLADEDPRSFALGETGVGWREHVVDPAAVGQLRPDLAASFGSCSFTDPVDDLKNLEML